MNNYTCYILKDGKPCMPFNKNQLCFNEIFEFQIVVNAHSSSRTEVFLFIDNEEIDHSIFKPSETKIYEKNKNGEKFIFSKDKKDYTKKITATFVPETRNNFSAAQMHVSSYGSYLKKTKTVPIHSHEFQPDEKKAVTISFDLKTKQIVETKRILPKISVPPKGIRYQNRLY